MRNHNALSRLISLKTNSTDKTTSFAPFIFVITCLIFFSCMNPLQLVDSVEEQEIKAELEDRSFRQFDPAKDANKRKGIIIDFFDGVNLWAQYAEGPIALNEWEISAKDYRVEKSGSEYRIYFEEPRSQQILPTQCDNCIETSGISISIRDLFDSKKMKFKLNIDNDNFPRPFPVFESWTQFSEDEYFD